MPCASADKGVGGRARGWLTTPAEGCMDAESERTLWGTRNVAFLFSIHVTKAPSVLVLRLRLRRRVL